MPTLYQLFIATFVIGVALAFGVGYTRFGETAFSYIAVGIIFAIASFIFGWWINKKIVGIGIRDVAEAYDKTPPNYRLLNGAIVFLLLLFLGITLFSASYPSFDQYRNLILTLWIIFYVALFIVTVRIWNCAWSQWWSQELLKKMTMTGIKSTLVLCAFAFLAFLYEIMSALLEIVFAGPIIPLGPFREKLPNIPESIAFIRVLDIAISLYAVTYAYFAIRVLRNERARRAENRSTK